MRTCGLGRSKPVRHTFQQYADMCQSALRSTDAAPWRYLALTNSTRSVLTASYTHFTAVPCERLQCQSKCGITRWRFSYLFWLSVLVSACKKLSYERWLIYLKLRTLKRRRYRGNMIETDTILNKLYDERVAPGVMQSSVITAWGHDFKLYTK